MDERLLGRPFLKSIGFNFKEHFERMRNQVHNKKVSELDFWAVDIAKASSREKHIKQQTMTLSNYRN